MKIREEESGTTRERLLQAAGEVFAEHGFRAATIREICRRAEANVAAINYHFGDKEGLYLEVLKYTLTSARQKYPLDVELPRDTPPEERLHSFVKTILSRTLDEGRPAWHGRLMGREIIEPTAAFERLIPETLRPIFARLESIVRGYLGEDADEELMRQCTLSIMAQCIFYHRSGPLLESLYHWKPGTRDIDRLAKHITRFSVEALTGLSKRRTKEK